MPSAPFTLQKLAVIGDPIAHSLSPVLQNFLIRRFGLPFTYEALHVRQNELPAMMQRLRAGEFRGLNVTIPHKQAVLPFLNELEATAAGIGAVNTIAVEGERLIGYNTDARGFERSLADLGAVRTALVLGAGGAARAVVFALLQARVKKIVVCNRNAERAATLLAAFADRAASHQLQSLAWSERTDWMKENTVHLLVNATRVGMHPDDEESPLPDEVFTEHVQAIDLVYNPVQTRFLAAANSAGAKTVNGLGMLIYQGVAALERWSGKQLDIRAVYSSIENELRRPLDVLQPSKSHSSHQR